MPEEREAAGLDNRRKWRLLSDLANLIIPHKIKPTNVQNPSIVDVTAYLYFIGFAPLIYVSFLRNFFIWSLRTPVEISYRQQVDESQDDGGRVVPHQASLYWPSIDVIINARPSDTGEQDLGAVGGIPSLLNNYDMYVGIPDVKPSHAHRITRDSPHHLDCPPDTGNEDTSPVLPH